MAKFAGNCAVSYRCTLVHKERANSMTDNVDQSVNDDDNATDPGVDRGSSQRCD
jgi:hypothetical protein